MVEHGAVHMQMCYARLLTTMIGVSINFQILTFDHRPLCLTSSNALTVNAADTLPTALDRIAVMVTRGLRRGSALPECMRERR